MKLTGHIHLLRGEELCLKTEDGHNVFIHLTKTGELAFSDERWGDAGYKTPSDCQIMMLTEAGWGIGHANDIGYDLLEPLVRLQQHTLGLP